MQYIETFFKEYPKELAAAGIVTVSIVLYIISIYTTSIPHFWILPVLLMVGCIADMLVNRRIKLIAIIGVLAVGSILIQAIPRVNQKGDLLNWAMIGPGLIKATIFATIIGVLIAVFLVKKHESKLLKTVEKTSNNIPMVPDLRNGSNITQEIEHPPVYLAKTLRGEKIIINGKDRYLHTLLIGSTGTGKTSAVLGPMVWQDLLKKHAGAQMGLTIVAPNSDFIYFARDCCRDLNIPFTLIDLDDPESQKFNPLEGDGQIVAEIMRTVLRSTFGEQEAFFAQAQELHAKNMMLLLKKLKGDNLTMMDVYQCLMDIGQAQDLVDEYRIKFGSDVITEYFQKEAFGINKDKIHQFAMGLRMQISDLLTNDAIANILVGKSDINLDQHMADGGVLLFNTGLGKMGRMSMVFGQFIIMHIQNAVFRRPGNEFDRIPHFLYIDELPVYFNPEFNRLLNLGRQYRCACTFTIQGPAQLETTKQGSTTRRIITNGCRNKIVIGIEDSGDAKLISEMFGEEEQTEIKKTRDRFSLIASKIQEQTKLKPRFPYTEILELPAWHGIIKTTAMGINQPPAEVKFEEPQIFRRRVANHLKNIPKHQLLVPQNEPPENFHN